MIKKTNETTDARKNQLKDHLSRLSSFVVISNDLPGGAVVVL